MTEEIRRNGPNVVRRTYQLGRVQFWSLLKEGAKRIVVGPKGGSPTHWVAVVASGKWSNVVCVWEHKPDAYLVTEEIFDNFLDAFRKYNVMFLGNMSFWRAHRAVSEYMRRRPDNIQVKREYEGVSLEQVLEEIGW